MPRKATGSYDSAGSRNRWRVCVRFQGMLMRFISYEGLGGRTTQTVRRANGAGKECIERLLSFLKHLFRISILNRDAASCAGVIITRSVPMVISKRWPRPFRLMQQRRRFKTQAATRCSALATNRGNFSEFSWLSHRSDRLTIAMMVDN